MSTPSEPDVTNLHTSPASGLAEAAEGGVVCSSSGLEDGRLLTPAAGAGIWPYVAAMRPEHWFKNVFMLMGTIAAVAAGEATLSADLLAHTVLAFALTCFAASANYVVNEILDAPYDRIHPVKRFRPVARGLVSVPILLLMTAGLAIGSLASGWVLVGPRLAFPIGLLLAQGVIYNVRPIRTKDIAYVDALSEAVNNPIRLLIGWFGVGAESWPPLSLLLSYWAIGAFLMTAKRFAEFRFIGAAKARAYRASFRSYSEEGLLITMIVYVSLTTFLYGVLALEYKPSLLLGLPLVLVFVAWFFHLSFEPDSIVKEPERLVRKPAFLIYCLVSLVCFVALSAVDLPVIERLLGLTD
jgi:4-hydroxybenzoate polyprenyltransferase